MALTLVITALGIIPILLSGYLAAHLSRMGSEMSEGPSRRFNNDLSWMLFGEVVSVCCIILSYIGFHTHWPLWLEATITIVTLIIVSITTVKLYRTYKQIQEPNGRDTV